MTPEERAYWEGTAGANMSAASDPNAAARLAQAQADADAGYYGPPRPAAPAPPPLAAGRIPGAITYDEGAKIPGAIQYNETATIPGAIPYTPPPPGREPVSIVRNGPGGDPYAPPPTGPTAADDAAFARSKAQASARNAAPIGAAAGAAANPFKGVNTDILQSLERQRAAAQGIGNAEADKIHMLGEHRKRIAQQEADDASLMKLENDEATRQFDGHMQEMQRQLDDVRSRKLDPMKHMNENALVGTLGVIGGLVGGLYQGLNHLQKNPFLEELKEKVAMQMAADEKNIANERAAVGDQMNLLAMNRATYKDKRLADMQTEAMYLEAAKAQAEASVADTDSEIAKQRAAQGVAILDVAIGQQKKAFIQESQKLSAAGAAAMYARQKERQATFKEIYKEALDKGLSPEHAEYEAMRVSAILYAPQTLQQLGDRPPAGEFDGMTVRDRSHMKREESVAQKESEAELAALRDFKKRIPELSAGSAVGDYWSGAPGFLPGVSSAKEHKLNRESYNATVARAYDAAMKAAQGSAPTESQKAQLKTFYLENNDGDEDVARKINAAEEFVVQAGRAKGLQDSTPRETEKALGGKPIK